MNPEEFEKQVARFISVIEGQGAIVSWNDRIPDPDNPERLRQIDVSIKRGGSLSVVECRLHSRPQDVKWIEELYGRKASLRAQMIMGVSSSGFTDGAWRKGQALGVFLRDLRELTEDEVRSWGRTTKVRLSYVHFKQIAIFLIPTSAVRLATPHPRTLLLKSNCEPWPLDDLFRGAASKLAEGILPEGIARIQYFVKELHIGSIPVPELVLQVKWKWVHRDIHLPSILAFRNHGEKPQSSEALVEKNHYSRTEVFHVKGAVFTTIDVSLAPVEPRSYLRRVNIDLGQPLPCGGIGLIGIDEPRQSLFKYKIHIYRRDSYEYRALMAEDPYRLQL